MLGRGSGADSVNGHGEEGGQEVGVGVPRGRERVAFRVGRFLVGVCSGGGWLLVGVVELVGHENGIFDEGSPGVQMVLDLVEVGFVVIVGVGFREGSSPLDGTPYVITAGDFIKFIVLGAMGG